MSKTDPDFPEFRDPALGPIPSFDAIRTDNETRSELRRNQTIDLPVGFRQQLAVQELPELPAEHLRATDDLDEALRCLPPEPNGKRWLAMTLAVLAAGAIGGGFWLWKSTSLPTPRAPIQPEPGVISNAAALTQPPLTVAGGANPVAEPEASATTRPELKPANPQRSLKQAERRVLTPTQPKADGSEREFDPDKLMYKPK